MKTQTSAQAFDFADDTFEWTGDERVKQAVSQNEKGHLPAPPVQCPLTAVFRSQRVASFDGLVSQFQWPLNPSKPNKDELNKSTDAQILN